MLTLRAHHFLCMQGFQGYGYSSDFVRNMTEIVNSIKENPHIKVKLADACDDICKDCTNNLSGRCKDFDKIKNMDMKVLNRLNLKSGSELTASELLNAVNQKLKNKEAADDICGECSWEDRCLWRISIR